MKEPEFVKVPLATIRAAGPLRLGQVLVAACLEFRPDAATADLAEWLGINERLARRWRAGAEGRRPRRRHAGTPRADARDRTPVTAKRTPVTAPADARDRASHNMGDVVREREKQTTAPPPSMRASPTDTASAGATSILDLAARAFARFDGRAGLLEVRGHIESDLAAGAYTPADLAAYLATGGAPAWPSQLKLVVQAHREAGRRAAFAEAIRRIRANGLTRAVYAPPGGPRSGPAPRTATVRYADPGAGLVILEELVGGSAGASADALRAEMAAAEEAADTPFKRDMLAARLRTLGERLAAVEAGRPDPAARPPERRRTDLASPEALADWRFEAVEPTLFPLAETAPAAGTDVIGSSSWVSGQEGKP